jgi:hypothetical protein
MTSFTWRTLLRVIKNLKLQFVRPSSEKFGVVEVTITRKDGKSATVELTAGEASELGVALIEAGAMLRRPYVT